MKISNHKITQYDVMRSIRKPAVPVTKWHKNSKAYDRKDRSWRND